MFVSKKYPQKIILDSTVHTSLSEEFLLNKDGELEVLKKYKNGKLVETYLVSNYPNSSVVENLHSMNIKQLQNLLKDLALDVEDKRVSSLIRKKVLSSLDNPILQEKMISITKEGGKEIWNSLKNYLPLYELFQADRKNIDQDDEIQDPMKLLIKELIKDHNVASKLEDVFEQISKQSEELANHTIEKLHDISPEIASELIPKFNRPSWESVFKFSLDSDKGIPVNKRGSGIRRMILLSFFRAQAERRKNIQNIPNIIYAIEEPETALHPTQQKLLIEAFLELSGVDVNQVILTTHSPSIAKLLSIESLRLIDKDTDQDNIVYDYLSKPTILEEIVDNLGVFPNFNLDTINKVKLAICVEGKNDISFLKTLSKNILELREIIDLENEEIIIIPMGGSTLQFWVNDNYLEKLNLSQLHIYDSDKGSIKPNKYQRYVEVINKRQRSRAFETKLREFENYITPTLLLEFYPQLEQEISELDWEKVDVADLIAKFNYESDSSSKGKWEDLGEEKQKKKKGRVKNKINNELVNHLTKEYLIKNDYYEEVKEWFNNAAYLLRNVK